MQHHVRYEFTLLSVRFSHTFANASTSGLILARKSALVLAGRQPMALDRVARAREFVPRYVEPY